MSRLYLAVGVLLLVGVVVDLLWTILWVEGGAGPLTSGLMAGTWRTLRRTARGNQRALTLAGPLILILTITTWVLLLWGGWTLVFASAESSITDTPHRGPVTWSDLIYFAGYTIFTLGNGDFYPTAANWQYATVLASASGMLFITLIVTYVLSVLGAVTQKRAFASSVSGLGCDGTHVVEVSWDGEAVQGLDVPLHSLAAQLDTLTSNHEAYPVLHYFHSRRLEQTAATSIAILDDALALLRFGLPDREGPSDVAIESMNSAVEGYLGMLRGTFVESTDRAPPVPDLEPLRDADVPVVTDAEFTAAVEELDERRRILLGLIESDVREWPSRDEG